MADHYNQTVTKYSMRKHAPTLDACTHARMHACTHARMHACTRARMHACMHARTHARTHTRTHLPDITGRQILVSAQQCLLLKLFGQIQKLTLIRASQTKRSSRVMAVTSAKDHQVRKSFKIHCDGSQVMIIYSINGMFLCLGNVQAFQFLFNV